MGRVCTGLEKCSAYDENKFLTKNFTHLQSLFFYSKYDTFQVPIHLDLDGDFKVRNILISTWLSVIASCKYQLLMNIFIKQCLLNRIDCMLYLQEAGLGQVPKTSWVPSVMERMNSVAAKFPSSSDNSAHQGTQKTLTSPFLGSLRTNSRDK
jgi:hypothetical protein